MARYKLIGGYHVQKESGRLKEYKRGDIIETEINLVSLFRGKFEIAYDNEQVAAKAEVKKAPKKPTVAEAAKALEEAKVAETAENQEAANKAKSKVVLGPDMTAMFFAVKGSKFRIHQSGSGYQVVNASGELQNTEGLLTKDEVNIYLESNKDA